MNSIMSSLGKRLSSSLSLSDSILEPSAKRQFSSTRLFTNTTDNNLQWISPSQLRNIIITGFDILNNNNNNNDNNEDSDSLMDLIMDQGKKFEDRIIQSIKETFPNDFIQIATSYTDINSDNAYYKTRDAMYNQIPIIYQGVLRNYKNNTHGMPDLIIHKSFINKLIPNTFEEEYASSVHAAYCPYFIIDIKNKLLDFKTSNQELKNDGSWKYIKAQLFIYNEALMNTYSPLIKETDKNIAFVLGRGYKHRTVKNNNIYERFGIVNFDKETQIKDITVSAIESKRTNSKLLTKEYPFSIQSIFGCTYQHVYNAYINNVTSPNDLKCTTQTLKITTPYLKDIVDNILHINQSNIPNYTAVNNYFSPQSTKWINKDNQHKYIDLFIDIETIAQYFIDTFEDFPKTQNDTITYMIGIGYYTLDQNASPLFPNQKYKFIHNTLNIKPDLPLTLKGEEFLMEKLTTFLYQILITTSKKIRLFHWGAIEQTVCKPYIDKILNKTSNANIEWYDMCKIIKDNKFAIKGSYSFKLKEIAQAMYTNNFIPSDISNLNYQVSINSGDSSIIMFKQIYDESLKTNIDFRHHHLYQNLIKYNFNDCYIMAQIVNAFQNNFEFPENKIDPSIEIRNNNF